MKTYDIAFSCGFGCGCAKALRYAKAQFASFPFDWVGTSLPVAARTIAANFKDWFNPEDLKLFDVRLGVKEYNRCYLNVRHGFCHAHDFFTDSDFITGYQRAKEKFDRRIERLLGLCEKSRRILAVYVEHPARKVLDDAAIVSAAQVLRKRFPAATVDLLYFHHQDGARPYAVRTLAEGVTSVGCDIATMEFGEVSHKIRNAPIVAYLQQEVAVTDYRTDADKARFAEQKKAVRASMERGSAWSRFVARLQLRTYHRLQKLLTKHGILPHDRPFIFD